MASPKRRRSSESSVSDPEVDLSPHPAPVPGRTSRIPPPAFVIPAVHSAVMAVVDKYYRLYLTSRRKLQRLQAQLSLMQSSNPPRLPGVSMKLLSIQPPFIGRAAIMVTLLLLWTPPTWLFQTPSAPSVQPTLPS
jgi:hypothetical protein